jgi:hypothetical protein
LNLFSAQFTGISLYILCRALFCKGKLLQIFKPHIHHFFWLFNWWVGGWVGCIHITPGPFNTAATVTTSAPNGSTKNTKNNPINPTITPALPVITCSSNHDVFLSSPVAEAYEELLIIVIGIVPQRSDTAAVVYQVDIDIDGDGYQNDSKQEYHLDSTSSSGGGGDVVARFELCL